MKNFACAGALLVLGLTIATSVHVAGRANEPLTPFRNTTTRGAYTIDTVGDTLNQASPQNARLIIRVFGPDKKVMKPSQIALVDKSGAVIKPVFREDRNVGHEENTGLPLSVSPQASTSGINRRWVSELISTKYSGRRELTLTRKSIGRSRFSPADKQLQIALSNGQTFLLLLTSSPNENENMTHIVLILVAAHRFEFGPRAVANLQTTPVRRERRRPEHFERKMHTEQKHFDPGSFQQECACKKGIHTEPSRKRQIPR